MARQPGIQEIIRRACDGRLLSVRTSISGEIVSYNEGTRRARVRAGVRVQAVDSDSPPEVDTLDDFRDVPVLFPGGANFESAWPLEAGDPVRLEFSEEDDLAFYDSTKAIPLTPEVLRRHGGSVVCRPEGNRGTPSSKATFIGSDGSHVLLGADDANLLVPDTTALLTALIQAVTAAAPVAADGGAALKTSLLAALSAIVPAFVSATKVKVK